MASLSLLPVLKTGIIWVMMVLEVHFISLIILYSFFNLSQIFMFSPEKWVEIQVCIDAEVVVTPTMNILSTFNKEVGIRAKGGLWIYFSACCSHIFCLSVLNLAWGKCLITLFCLLTSDYLLTTNYYSSDHLLIYLLKYTMSHIWGRTWK